MRKTLMDRIKTIFFLDKDEADQHRLIKKVREIRHWELADARKKRLKRKASPVKRGKKPMTKTAKKNKALRDAQNLLAGLTDAQKKAILKKFKAEELK